ncbi:MAG: TldD/PmbA family protein [Anaerolineae bacterium]|nr:TldD/PmbA family protein [Anaerolineae bacterium]MDH7472426.1 TldD/PmbA family protein [Anaerolineae bacterium]
MLGEKGVKEIADHVLAHSNADQTEVVIISQDSQLTRFANSTIHQNVAELNTQVNVRAVLGKRIGVASTNDLNPEALKRVTETALTIARLQPENPDFISLPGPAPIIQVHAFDEATAACTPETRARAVDGICRQAIAKGLTAAGAFSTTIYEIAVVNSLGVFAYHPSTGAELNMVIMSEDSSGYAAQVSTRVADLDAESLGCQAVDKALRSRNPRALSPGHYTVILEPYAVQDFLSTFAYLGFGAQTVQEGQSFMAGRFGERIMSEAISIWDDGLDPTGLPLPFDFEGQPKQRVDLISHGVAQAVVYDSYTAGKEGKQSTGHALPAPNTYGPLPFNLFMDSGQATLEDMIASTEHGLLVTRFWYTRPVHPRLVIVTGMTRDGTFLIERGEVACPVKNLRFTQSYLDALAQVELVSRERRLLSDFGGADYVPALKLSEFTFTGVTEF